MDHTVLELKKIKYRGGLVNFSIPAGWVEEYDPNGGGTFYEDNPDAGTLRLNVLTIESPRELTGDSAFEILAGRGEDRQIRRLPNDNAVARYMLPANDRGHDLHIHYWELASPCPPRHLRLAIFSYTLLAKNVSEPSVQAELNLLDSSIGEAEFSKVLGNSGLYPGKPWWKFW